MTPRRWAGLFYLASFAALGAIFPYLSVIARARHFGPVETGMLLSLGPTANALVPPIWGVLADRLRARATMLAIASLACTGAVWLLVANDSVWGTAGAVAVLWLFRAPLVPLADATARAVLGQQGLAFGHIRAWGSLGYSLAVIAAGAVGILAHLNWVVAGTAVAYFAAALTALKIGNAAASPETPSSPSIALPSEANGSVEPMSLSEDETPRPALPPAAPTLPALFLVATAIYGGAHAISDGFFPVYVLDLGHPESLIGLGWGLGVGLEIVIMFAAPRLLARVDAVRLLQIAVAAGAIRWWGVATVTGAVPLVLLQLIHAVSFGMWYVALVEAVQRSAPGHLRATAQGAVTSAIGLGQLIGFVGGGELYRRGSAPLAFGVAGSAAAVAALLYGRHLARSIPHATTATSSTSVRD